MYYLKTYTEAKSIKEASEILLNNDNAMIIAGGTDVLINIKNFKEGYTNKDLVGITRIEELSGIEKTKDEIIIKSATKFSDIEDSLIIKENIPILAKAASVVGGPQIRNIATIGGNICNAASSADSASSLFALNAILLIKSANYEKEMPIWDFYLGAGKNALKRGEILTAIKIKAKDYEGYKGEYIKFAQRKAMDIATIGVAVLLKHDKDLIKDIRLAYGVAAATPIRTLAAEEFAKDLVINDDNLDLICEKILSESKTRDSWRASKVFRDNLIKVLTKRAILKIIGKDDEY